MSLPMEPLDEAEKDELDNFLLNRGKPEPGDAFLDGCDAGILTLSELDGFFTAIVSGPEAIAQSRWWPVVWGDVEPAWSKQSCEHIRTLLSRHMGAIATSLLSEHGCQPLFMDHEVEGTHHLIVHEWCKGYMRGIELALDQWQCGGDEMVGLLMPIDIFTHQWGWRILEKLNKDDKETLKQEIAPAARAIHSYWLGRRRR